MDGTLLDSMHIWRDAGINYLNSIGVPPKPGLRERLRPLSLSQGAVLLCREYALPTPPEEICRQINAAIAGFYRQEAVAKPGVKEFLHSMKQRGIPLCVLTATDKHLAKAGLQNAGILHFFDFILTCREAGLNKDEPEIFDAVLARLQTEKATTWVFEDALYAVRSARAAGFPIAAVYDKTADVPGMQAEIEKIADLYARSLTEMEGFFK